MTGGHYFHLPGHCTNTNAVVNRSVPIDRLTEEREKDNTVEKAKFVKNEMASEWARVVGNSIGLCELWARFDHSITDVCPRADVINTPWTADKRGAARVLFPLV